MKNSYIFDKDWFSSNIAIWEPILEKFKTEPTKVLEIGSHEGRSAVWLCENILLHPDSYIKCVDIFDDEIIHEHFKHNVSFFSNKLSWYKGTSRQWLKDYVITKDEYDIVYVDGDHSAFAALEDAVLTFPLLKVGGIMIFDDFMGGGKDFGTTKAPYMGVVAFKDCYADKIEVIHNGYQLIVKKISQ